MAGVLAPQFFWTALDDAGDPIDGALLKFYLTGSSTQATTYHDADLSSAWTWPVECDSAGRAVVYFDPALGALKLIQTDPDGVQVGPTVDPVTPVNSGAASGLGTVFDFMGNPEALVANTSYNAGTSFSTLHPGTGVYVVDAATLTGTYKLRVTGLQNTAGTLTVAIVDLSSGAPDTPLATATITSATGEVATSATSITFGAPGTDRQYGIKTKVSANTGQCWAVTLIQTA